MGQLSAHHGTRVMGHLSEKVAPRRTDLGLAGRSLVGSLLGPMGEDC